LLLNVKWQHNKKKSIGFDLSHHKFINYLYNTTNDALTRVTVRVRLWCITTEVKFIRIIWCFMLTLGLVCRRS